MGRNPLVARTVTAQDTIVRRMICAAHAARQEMHQLLTRPVLIVVPIAGQARALTKRTPIRAVNAVKPDIRSFPPWARAVTAAPSGMVSHSFAAMKDVIGLKKI